MSKDIENMLIIVSDSENMIRDDNLAKVVESATQELTDEELDFVVAAAKPDYQKFLDKFKKNDT